jgi:hypothetical protein
MFAQLYRKHEFEFRPHLLGKLAEEQSMGSFLKTPTKDTVMQCRNIAALELLSRGKTILSKSPQSNLYLPGATIAQSFFQALVSASLSELSPFLDKLLVQLN